MKDANAKVFASLDETCLRLSFPLANTGKPRWIDSSEGGKDFLKNVKLEKIFRFSPQKIIAQLRCRDKTFVCSVGFEAEMDSILAHEESVRGGELTAVLSELAPRPAATAPKIKDIVEIDISSGSNYNGHSPLSIATLFPRVRLFEDDRSLGIWVIFFRFAVAELEVSDVWLDETLTSLLIDISDLDPKKIPFDVLCRSVFDSDPSSFFLALYRCLEAIFSYSAAMKLKPLLNSPNSWEDISKNLERVLGWRPSELSSLQALLAHALPADLARFMDAISEPIPSNEENLVPNSSKKLYSLRNSCVHQRPARNVSATKDTNWNEVCCATALIVLHVYDEVFDF